MKSGQTTFFSQFEPVVYPSTLAAADFDLVCFGHIHRLQQLDGCKNTFHCGAISALNFNDEGQERGYYIHDIDDNGAVTSAFRHSPHAAVEDHSPQGQQRRGADTERTAGQGRIPSPDERGLAGKAETQAAISHS